MNLDRFLNLLATIIGALGSIYVMRGVVGMSPEMLERQTHSYWDFSTPQIEALASQKADSIAGVAFIVIAFLLAAVSLAFVPDNVRVFQGRGLALGLCAILAGILYVTLMLVGKGIYQEQRLAIGRIIAGRYVSEIVAKGKLDLADAKSLPTYARELLDMSVSGDERPRDILDRIAAETGRVVPAHLDTTAVDHVSPR